MEDTFSIMVKYLTLPETIDLSRVDKSFNSIVQHRIGLRAPEILRLKRIIHNWHCIRKRPKTRKGSRNNSWARVVRHPDDRIIF